MGIGRSLTNSAKSKISISAETLFQLVRCGPRGASRRRRTGPVPAIRWSVASGWRTRIRGSTGFRVLTRDDGSRTSPRTVVDVALGPEVVSGFDPSYSVLVRCCLAQDPFPPLSSSEWWRRGDSNS
jgi:hypothetical protein